HSTVWRVWRGRKTPRSHPAIAPADGWASPAEEKAHSPESPHAKIAPSSKKANAPNVAPKLQRARRKKNGPPSKNQPSKSWKREPNERSLRAAEDQHRAPKTSPTKIWNPRRCKQATKPASREPAIITGANRVNIAGAALASAGTGSRARFANPANIAAADP